MNKGEKSTLWVGDDTKDELDKLKIIEQEPYDSVIKRLIEFKKTHAKPEATA